MTNYAHVLSTITRVSQNELRVVLGGIKFDGKELVVVGDRGNYLHIFIYDVDSNSFKRGKSFQAHDGWVSCAAYVKPCELYPQGAIVTGGYDHFVKVWNLESFKDNSDLPLDPIAVFIHDKEVCSLCSVNDNSGRIISTGWDSTCRVWCKKSDNPIILRHEQYSIWSAAAIPGGYVTCGADKTIRIWSTTGESVKVISDAHKDCVRSSVYIPEKNLFVSCANDGTIKEWQVNGLSLEYLSTISCTDSYLYTISLLNNDTYLVCSEDRCVYVASSDTKKVVDVLPLPDIVWSVSTLLNNDVICCSPDGMIRTFTNDPVRRCDKEVEETYLQNLSCLTFSNQDLDNINILDLPDINTLTTENAQAGSATLVRNGDNKVICTWSNGYQRWLQIGILVNSKEGQSKEKVADEHGNLWDYCFNIQMEDGRSFPLYLNYDTNEYTAAYDFMTKHNLDPHYYLSQIIDFIHKNRAQKVIDSATSNALFPMKTPNFYKEVNTAPIINKLRSLNSAQKNHPVLTEEQLQLLGAPISLDVFEIIETIALNWPYDQMWPVLDILRARITEPNARVCIPAPRLVKIVLHIKEVDAVSSPEFLVLMIMRVVSNMFLNYSAEVMTDIDVFEILEKFAIRFNSSSPRTQVGYSTLMLNYSTSLSFNPDKCVALMNIIISILKPSIDVSSMHRLIYACGNVAFFSSEAKLKLQLHPEVITNIRSMEQIPNEINTALTGLANLISA